MSEERYQLLLPLAAAEYDALKADIAKRGVIVPVEYDESGNILDGHHRVRICRELGLPDPPRRTRTGMSEAEKREFVLKLNLLRRHMGPIAWAAAFRLLAEERGVPLGRGGDRRSTATVAVDSAAGLAKELGVAPRTARYRLNLADQLADKPELAAKVDSGEVEAKTALRSKRDDTAAEKRDQRERETRAAISSDLRREARLGGLATALDDLAGSVDAVITDPPYPREFLPLFGDLADLADRILKPDGVLAVMVGQAHLPTVFRLLDGRRPYRWTIAYMTPGPDGVVHGRARVASAWKPVIVYGGGRRFRDVVTSAGDDKSLHHWQQDEDGFRQLVDMLTEPGHLVVDPFMGSGTTLLAALALGRHAIGCDIDPAAVETARKRIA